MMRKLLRAVGSLLPFGALWLLMIWALSREGGMTAEDAQLPTALCLCAWGMALAFRRQGRSRRRGARIAWGLAGTALNGALWLLTLVTLGTAGMLDENGAVLLSALFWAAWGAFFAIRRAAYLRRERNGGNAADDCGAGEARRVDAPGAGRSAPNGTREQLSTHECAARREDVRSAGDETRLGEARRAAADSGEMRAADGAIARVRSAEPAGAGRTAFSGARMIRRMAAFCAAGALLIAALAVGVRSRRVEIPEALEVFAQKYPEAAGFVSDYPAHYRDHPSKDVSGEVKKGVVPLFIQWDERWGYEDYGGNYFAVNGCGPTCLSMVVCGLTGETDANPYAVACYSQAQGYYTPGSGTSWSLMTRGAAHYGLDATRVDLSAEAITGALAQGRVIIASMKPGDFTYTGHFIVLTGLDGDGRVRVNDSNSRINSAKSWDAQTLVDQMKGAWSYTLAR